MKLTERDVLEAKNIVCEKCSNDRFVNVFFIKHISALMSPNGQEVNAPIPTFACSKCDHINNQFLPPDNRQTP